MGVDGTPRRPIGRVADDQPAGPEEMEPGFPLRGQRRGAAPLLVRLRPAGREQKGAVPSRTRRSPVRLDPEDREGRSRRERYSGGTPAADGPLPLLWQADFAARVRHGPALPYGQVPLQAKEA